MDKFKFEVGDLVTPVDTRWRHLKEMANMLGKQYKITARRKVSSAIINGVLKQIEPENQYLLNDFWFEESGLQPHLVEIKEITNDEIMDMLS